jgi:hypothetical protein
MIIRLIIILFSKNMHLSNIESLTMENWLYMILKTSHFYIMLNVR